MHQPFTLLVVWGLVGSAWDPFWNLVGSPTRKTCSWNLLGSGGLFLARLFWDLVGWFLPWRFHAFRPGGRPDQLPLNPHARMHFGGGGGTKVLARDPAGA